MKVIHKELQNNGEDREPPDYYQMKPSVTGQVNQNCQVKGSHGINKTIHVLLCLFDCSPNPDSKANCFSTEHGDFNLVPTVCLSYYIQWIFYLMIVYILPKQKYNINPDINFSIYNSALTSRYTSARVTQSFLE